MATDHIRYDLLTQQALRGVVRSVLADAAKKPMPGEHHFYISFDTHADGVKLSQRLREQYPEEMTIILQHQFWDLNVSDEHFEVGLSFGGIPERLTVPFEAIKSFFDPSVQFGLQFEEATEQSNGAAAAAPIEEKTGDKRRKPARQDRKPVQARPTPVAANPPDAALPSPAPVPDSPKSEKSDKNEKSDKSEKPAGGAEVVRLDRFRKK